MTPEDPLWASEVEPALRVDAATAVNWDEAADLVIVGLGGAGVAAAVDAAEQGLEVLALDRYGSGGSSAANGGVFYAGGGTRIQREAGVEDSVEDMYRYLKLETRGIVSDATLRAFCESSPATIDWLLERGAKLSADGVYRHKVSYPPLHYHLYHADNSLLPAYAAEARPAARGHRTAVSNKGKAWGLGVGIWGPLQQAALRAGMRFVPHAEGRQLILDTEGRVLGIKALVLRPGEASRRFTRCIRRASFLLELLPPVIPLAGITIALARRYLAAAARIEAQHRVERYIRARYGVLLSTGGFILNQTMVRHYAPRYQHGMPNGTLGDTGSGIRLGQTAGGATGAMDRVTGWCNINPPAAWARGIVVNRDGNRVAHEGAYGSTLGDAVVHSPGSRAWLILDRELLRKSWREILPGTDIVRYQRQAALLNLVMNRRSASTLAALARRIGVAPDGLASTVERYNAAARGESPDEFGKSAADMSELRTPRYHAIDVSVQNRYFPLPTLTLGGLQVSEKTGQVLDLQGRPIAGLYAAGRAAVGICSQVYVSGLAYADCIFSGRRVARAMLQTRDDAAADDHQPRQIEDAMNEDFR